MDHPQRVCVSIRCDIGVIDGRSLGYRLGGVSYFLRSITTRTAAVRFFQQVLDSLFADFENRESAIRLLSMLRHDWHIQLGYFLPKFSRFEVGLEFVLSHLSLVSPGDALFLTSSFIEHAVICLDQHLFRVLPPIILGQVLWVGRVNSHILSLVHLDYQLLNV